MVLNFGYSQKKFSPAEVEKFQKQINAEYADAKTSPLMEEDLKTFKTLELFSDKCRIFCERKVCKSRE